MIKRTRCPWCRFYLRKNEKTSEYQGKVYHVDCVKALRYWKRSKA